ncbi:hypothetical protein GCM10022217_26000 [Chryseobacterium ginsenosidimutans]
MENTKQQRVETLVNDLLKEFQEEPTWKFKWLIQFLEKAITENSTINNDIGNIWENYSSDSFILFSNSVIKD